MFRQLLPIFCFLAVGITLPTQGVESTPAKGAGAASFSDPTLAALQLKIRNVYDQASLARQNLPFEVFQKAMVGYLNLKSLGQLSQKPYLTIVDFSKSSREKRLWVVDLEKKSVLYHTLVAHGRNTGDEYARHFSNTSESYMSSLGFYVTAESYIGKHGLSLKLHGKDEKYNSNALSRAVVIHGADYVSENFIKQHGRLGRSFGCPALPADLNDKIVNLIKEGTCLYLHYPSKDYSSKYLDTRQAIRELLEEKLEI